MISSPSNSVRLFLGWESPSSVAIAKELIARGAFDPEKPLHIIVPTKESLRALKEQLAIASAEGSGKGAYISPRISTLQQIVGQQSHLPCASPAIQLILWKESLQQHAAQFPQQQPGCQNWNEENWMHEAAAKMKLFKNLTTEDVSCEHPHWEELAEQDKRWGSLREIYTHYQSLLEQQQLSDPNLSDCLNISSDTKIILAAVHSIPRRFQRILAESGKAIELWIHAPAETNEHFDAWGQPSTEWLQHCSAREIGLIPESREGQRGTWQENFVLSAELWKMSELASDRAAEINYQQKGAIHCVSLGICDAKMESAVEEELQHHGSSCYRPRGIPFASSGWTAVIAQMKSLLQAIQLAEIPLAQYADYPIEPSLELLKMPLLATAESGEAHEQMAQLLDKIQFRQHPSRISGLLKYAQRGEHLALIEHIHRLGQFLQFALSDSTSLIAALLELSTKKPFPSSSLRDRSAAQIHAQFSQQVHELLQELQQQAPRLAKMSSESMLHLIDMSCQGMSALTPRPEQALDLQGWMELTLSPAKHLIICGMHDEIIPERWGIDAYLTPHVRELFELKSDEQRAARDAYLLRSMIACRPAGMVSFYFSLCDGAKNPLSPSSLLLRLCPEEHLAALVGHFFASHEGCPSSEMLPFSSKNWQYKQLGQAAKENKAKENEGNGNTDLYGAKKKDEMSDTNSNTSSRAEKPFSLAELRIDNPLTNCAFSPSILKEYLQCPLRFWIKQIEKLDGNKYESRAKNLAAHELGSCIHHCLEHFVRRYPSYEAFRAEQPQLPEQAEAQDPETLRLLSDALEVQFELSYRNYNDSQHLLPQRIQEINMRKRILSYAPLHAQIWAEGWSCARDREGALMLEYRPQVKLWGHQVNCIIDRIDSRIIEGEQQWRILDYKTGRIETCSKQHLDFISKDSREKLYELFGEDQDIHPCITRRGNSNKAMHRWVDFQLPLYVACLEEILRAEGLLLMFGKSIQTGYISLPSLSRNSRLILWENGIEEGLFAEKVIDEAESSKKKTDASDEVAEQLYENACHWMRACMDYIHDGKGLISAEELGWAIPKYSPLNEISQQEELTSCFLSSAAQH